MVEAVETTLVKAAGDVRLLKDQYLVLAEPFRVKLCICQKEPKKKTKKQKLSPWYPIMHDGTIRFILVSDDSREIIMTRLSG